MLGGDIMFMCFYAFYVSYFTYGTLIIDLYYKVIRGKLKNVLKTQELFRPQN